MLLKFCRPCALALVFVFCALSARTAWAWPGLSAAFSSEPSELGVSPTGACCKIDGVCTDNVTQANCIQVGASWGGGGSTCISNICGPIGGCCVNGFCTTNQSRRYCEIAAGGTWVPVCGDPNCNPVGACCIAGACSEQTENLCFLNGGEFQGGGSTCNDSPCEGACCLPLGSGCIQVTQISCEALSGAYQGNSTLCSGSQCPGACCGGFGCYISDEYGCVLSGDSFVGGPCENANCVIPTGACCRDEGVCIDNLDLGNCVEFGGAYAGNNTVCANNPCAETGACCYDSSGTSFCQDPTFQTVCLDGGGTFQGPGSTCAGNACGTATTGACCFTGGCQQFTPTQCLNVAGLYRGDHTVCTPNGCCPADFNNDGSVNTPDLTYFLGRFGGTFNPPGSERADLNADGVVNTADLTRFLGAFGKACPY
ncbi:MAG: GC-type dockerin domain-anchored protein [Phycisphaerales bacterium]